jgi:hypothetical protein
MGLRSSPHSSFCLSSQGSGCEYIEYCHWDDSLIDWVDSRGLSQYIVLTLLVFKLNSGHVSVSLKVSYTTAME